jgi:hypothetical protein
VERVVEDVRQRNIRASNSPTLRLSGAALNVYFSCGRS